MSYVPNSLHSKIMQTGLGGFYSLEEKKSIFWKTNNYSVDWWLIIKCFSTAYALLFFHCLSVAADSFSFISFWIETGVILAIPWCVSVLRVRLIKSLIRYFYFSTLSDFLCLWSAQLSGVSFAGLDNNHNSVRFDQRLLSVLEGDIFWKGRGTAGPEHNPSVFRFPFFCHAVPWHPSAARPESFVRRPMNILSASLGTYHLSRLSSHPFFRTHCRSPHAEAPWSPMHSRSWTFFSSVSSSSSDSDSVILRILLNRQ